MKRKTLKIGAERNGLVTDGRVIQHVTEYNYLGELGVTLTADGWDSGYTKQNTSELRNDIKHFQM